MNNHIVVKIFLLALISSPSILMGQSPAEIGATQQHDQLIREQQQLRQDQQRRIEQEQRNRQSIEFERPSNPTSLGGPCFDITSIELQGAEKLASQEQQKITAPFVNQCIGLDQINQLLEAISHWYFDRGYVTSRAYISDQDLNSGHLVISVIEGAIENIELLDATHNINITTAFPNKQGKLLNLRDVEQGLEQINRLQSRQVTMDLLPGQELGASTIQIRSQVSRPWQLSFTRNNSGQADTGENLHGVFFSLDNPLGLNDYAFINYQGDNTSSGERANKSVSLHWDVPIGYWTLGTDLNYFDYDSTVDSVAIPFDTSGDSFSQRLSLSRVLVRDQTSKLTARAQLERKDTRNFIEDTLIETSSRVLSIANIGLDYEKFLPSQTRWQLGFNYHRGLNIFDALSDKNRVSGTPRAQFEKYTASIDFQKQFAFNIRNSTLPITAQSTLNLQQSNDLLFGSEQISVGSLFTVRGFKGSSISGASGGYLRNSLTFHWQPGWRNNWVQLIQPMIAFDAGAIRDREEFFGDDRFQDLMGWAVGTRIAGSHYDLNVTYARPIHRPQFLSARQEELYFTLSFKM